MVLNIDRRRFCSLLTDQSLYLMALMDDLNRQGGYEFAFVNSLSVCPLVN